MSTRRPLTRERVLAAAVTLADRGGLERLSMRKLAEALGVEAMSLYHHVKNKNDLLDGIVDVVFAEISLPSPRYGWKIAMRKRAISAREVLKRHPWALGLLDSRSAPGPALLRHHDAVIGCLRKAGFTIAMAAHAFSLLDSYIYGFVLQELNLPFETPGELERVADSILRSLPADQYPHFTEMITAHALRPGYAYAKEFLYGLELILDGLEREVSATRRGRARSRGAL